ncbi:MAG: 3-carboxy-cis,cis-muconate cycloisomerase [Chloroflexota bacterium]
MPADRLFGPIFTTPAMAAAVSDEAWLRAMLDFEAALARAEGRLGVIPVAAAEAIASACAGADLDIETIGRQAAASGTPVVPMLQALRARLPSDATDHLHRGATSQDVLDTAMMLVVRHGLELLAADLEAVAAGAAHLARHHGGTLMVARTLLQQAAPTTFGLKAAGWLGATMEAADGLADYRRSRPAVQLGGAAGTLAALASDGPAVVRELAGELGLAAPLLPWHTARARVSELGAVLALVAGTMGKIALDVVLLAQSEVGEVAEPAGEGRGVSSSMPHKRNPASSVAALACARGVQAQAGLLLDTMVQPHERATGEWQSEWAAVSEALRLCAGAVSRMREVLEGLEVHPDRMRANLEAGGELLSEEAGGATAQLAAGQLIAATLAAYEARRRG